MSILSRPRLAIQTLKSPKYFFGVWFGTTTPPYIFVFAPPEDTFFGEAGPQSGQRGHQPSNKHCPRPGAAKQNSLVIGLLLSGVRVAAG